MMMMASEEMQENIMMSHLLKSEAMSNSPKDLNVVAMLHHFWQKKQTGQLNEPSSSELMEDLRMDPSSLLLLYESAPAPGPPYVCETQAEARRDAARVCLEDSCDPGTSIGTYSMLLHSYAGRTMLEFQVRKAYGLLSASFVAGALLFRGRRAGVVLEGRKRSSVPRRRASTTSRWATCSSSAALPGDRCSRSSQSRAMLLRSMVRPA
ncbi:hypothetical protein CRUP_009206 [Coryphaenoides rupestris]|nr:hypothetical protein CRUP_009206 [Coryphaenoides rupestris]